MGPRSIRGPKARLAGRRWRRPPREAGGALERLRRQDAEQENRQPEGIFISSLKRRKNKVDPLSDSICLVDRRSTSAGGRGRKPLIPDVISLRPRFDPSPRLLLLLWPTRFLLNKHVICAVIDGFWLLL